MITKKRQMLAVPQININGTSRGELQMQCREVYDALIEAQKALMRMTPHGRDYQTIGFETYELARSQHLDRVRSIEHLLEEIHEISVSLL
jgi:hypothetical protein